MAFGEERVDGMLHRRFDSLLAMGDPRSTSDGEVLVIFSEPTGALFLTARVILLATASVWRIRELRRPACNSARVCEQNYSRCQLAVVDIAGVDAPDQNGSSLC